MLHRAEMYKGGKWLVNLKKKRKRRDNEKWKIKELKLCTRWNSN
jgi:hypothetical protein